jgi:hypothetical protein
MEKNYSLVIAVIVIPVIAVGFIIGKKFKRVSPVVVEKPAEKIVEKIIERVVDTPEKKYEDGYDTKLSAYLSEQIKLKLDEMHSTKIISDSKYSKISASNL